MDDVVNHSVVAERVATLRTRMNDLSGGRSVELVAVTKGFGPDAIAAALSCGCRSIGESYAQELRDKFRRLTAHALAPEVHFIGQLQRNKVRMIAPLVHVWQSVDRDSLATEIARHVAAARVFVQVDITGEAGKAGCPPQQVPDLVEHCRGLGMQVEGLMTVGPTNGDVTVTRMCFRTVRRLANELQLENCSMGMSGDLDIAIEEGSTHVRVGTAIFGERPRREL